MERIWETMAERNRGNHSAPTSRDELQKYMDSLDRDCVRYCVRTLCSGELVVAISDTHWCVGEYYCPTDWAMAEIKFSQEVK